MIEEHRQKPSRRESDYTDCPGSKGICVFHAANENLYNEFKEALSDIRDAVQLIDKDLVRLTTAAKVRTAFFGTALAVVAGITGYFVNDIGTLKSTVKNGMEQRIRLEERVKSIEEDISDIKDKSVGYNHPDAFKEIQKHLDRRR